MDMMDMCDMAKTSEEKARSYGGMSLPCIDNDYPYGLTLCLTQDELAKLDLDDTCEVGDMVCFQAVAKVTSVMCSESETEGKKCRIELQITHMCCDDMDDEAGEGDEYPEGD